MAPCLVMMRTASVYGAIVSGCACCAVVSARHAVIRLLWLPPCSTDTLSRAHHQTTRRSATKPGHLRVQPNVHLVFGSNWPCAPRKHVLRARVSTHLRSLLSVTVEDSHLHRTRIGCRLHARHALQCQGTHSLIHCTGSIVCADAL